MAADADRNHEIDIEAMARKIEEKVSGEMPISPLCSIFRIPTTQLRQNLKAYVPDGFSFGPLHHGKENLELTEKIKAKYLRDLISRLSPAKTRLMMIKKFTEAISKKRKEARECYFGPVDIFFNLTLSFIDEKPLVQLAIEFFGNIFSNEPIPIRPLLSHPSKHILDLVRNSLVLNSSILKNGDNRVMVSFEPMPSAKSLLDSGISFKMGISESILDIRFNRKEGILEIPTLIIQETTETLFRNLISLEQCCPNYDPLITSYAVLLTT